MGKGRILFAGAIFSAFVTGLFANSFSAEAGGNCQSKLVGNSYNCTLKEQVLGSGSFTFEFETGGISQNFDLIIDATADYGCSCNTTGSVASPKFNSSSSDFECISVSIGYLFSGKVSGKKITGQGTTEGGDGLIFTCTKK